MNGENRFSVRNVIGTAWHNLKGVKWPIWAPQLVMLVIYIGVGAIFGILGAVIGVLPHAGMPIDAGFYIGTAIFEIVVIFLVTPLITGIQMVGLKKVRGESVDASAAFRYWHLWLPLGFSVLVFTIGNLIINQVFKFLIMASVGLPVVTGLLSIIMVIIAFLYVTFFIFNMLFIVDKGKGPISALGHSAKMVTPHWFRVFVILLFLGVVLVIAALPAILGFFCSLTIIKVLGVLVSIVLMIWAVPYWNLLISTTFHKLSGSSHE